MQVEIVRSAPNPSGQFGRFILRGGAMLWGGSDELMSMSEFGTRTLAE